MVWSDPMEADEYRKLAEVEDRMWYFRALNRRIVRFLARAGAVAPAGARLLDAGCGTGGLLRDLRRAFPSAELTGLDFSARACALARERTDATVVEGTVTALPFASCSFDAVVSADVVCQVEDGARALRELARVVRPGGTVVVNVPAFLWLWSYHDDTCQTRRRFTRPEVRALFAAAGLVVDFDSYANLPALPLIWARRKLLPPVSPTSDVRLYPRPVETIFSAMASLEFAWLRLGVRSPVGSSVFVVGHRAPP